MHTCMHTYNNALPHTHTQVDPDNSNSTSNSWRRMRPILAFPQVPRVWVVSIWCLEKPSNVCQKVSTMAALVRLIKA